MTKGHQPRYLVEVYLGLSDELKTAEDAVARAQAEVGRLDRRLEDARKELGEQVNRFTHCRVFQMSGRAVLVEWQNKDAPATVQVYKLE